MPDQLPRPEHPVYTDDIVTGVPDAPYIPDDIEEIGTRLVLVELELERLRLLVNGMIGSFVSSEGLT